MFKMGRCTQFGFLCLVLSSIIDAKTWKDYNLTVGPKKNESGRYIYMESSARGNYHCRYCELKAVKDSTYSYMQQPLCIRNYQNLSGNMEDHMLPQEIKNKRYPICETGEVPVCKAPPNVNKTENHIWYCDPGYSNVNYSVYFSCGLVCNVTDKVQWSYYCNESHQWEVEPASPWEPCQVPVTVEEKSQVWIFVVVGVSFLVIVLLITIYCCWRRRRKPISWCCWKKKREPRPEVEGFRGEAHTMKKVNNANRPGNTGNTAIQPDSVALIIEDDDTQPNSSSSDREDSIGTSPSSENEPLIRPKRPTMTDTCCGPDDNEESKLGAVGGVLPSNNGGGSEEHGVHNKKENKPQHEKPGIKIIILKGKNSKRSIPHQSSTYSIMKGLDFAIYPNSPGEVRVTSFKIERKGDGPRFRGTSIQEASFFQVLNASLEDVGSFRWTMWLENEEVHQGVFEILIYDNERDHIEEVMPGDLDSLGDPGERGNPIGAENDSEPIRSVRNPVNSIQPPSSVPHLTLNSVLKSSNTTAPYKDNQAYMNPGVQHVQAHCFDVAAQVHPVVPNSALVHGELPNTGDLEYQRLSSSFLRYRQSPSNKDSGMEELNRSSHEHSRNNNRIRSGNLNHDSSGYGSQGSCERAREQYSELVNGVPILDINSLRSQNDQHPSNRYQLTNIDQAIPEEVSDQVLGDDNLDSTRPQPAGEDAQPRFSDTDRDHHQVLPKEVVPTAHMQPGTELGAGGAMPHYEERVRDYADDPEQVHRKQVVSSAMLEPPHNQQDDNLVADDTGVMYDHFSDMDDFDDDEFKDNSRKKKIEDIDSGGDVDSLSERLTSGLIQNPLSNLTPETFENVEMVNSVRRENVKMAHESEGEEEFKPESGEDDNELVIPRSEIEKKVENEELTMSRYKEPLNEMKNVEENEDSKPESGEKENEEDMLGDVEKKKVKQNKEIKYGTVENESEAIECNDEIERKEDKDLKCDSSEKEVITPKIQLQKTEEYNNSLSESGEKESEIVNPRSELDISNSDSFEGRFVPDSNNRLNFDSLERMSETKF